MISGSCEQVGRRAGGVLLGGERTRSAMLRGQASFWVLLPCHRTPTSSTTHSPAQEEVGKGAFQECDQLAAVAGHAKWARQAGTHADIPGVGAAAFEVGRGAGPGCAGKG